MNQHTASLLEQHFDTAFASPEGVARLRELILTLAMQGKLVEQDPEDQPASELLKEIAAEKQRLIDEKEIRKQRPLPAITEEEIPYQLPENWEWVRLRDIGHDWGQKTPDNQFTYIDVGSINNDTGEISSPQLVEAAAAPSRARKIVQPGTIIYSTVRPYLLNIAVIEKEYEPEAIASTAFAIIHPFKEISAKFIYYYLRSPSFISYVESTQKGVAYPAINDGNFFSGVFPLPPITEQYRIADKINELMTRCDALELLHQQHAEKRLKVHSTAIQQLLEQPEGNAWNFIQQHFNELYSVPENVAELRKTILQLAVMGRLVPQDPNDPPASQLLEEIQAEKERLIAEKIIRRQKPLPPITKNETHYKLPKNWQWTHLDDLGITQTGATPSRKDTENFGNHIPFIGPGNIQNNSIDYSGNGLSKLGLTRGRTIKKNSILMVCIGGSIGKHAINNIDVSCNQQINTITPYPGISTRYLFYVTGSNFFQNKVLERAGGSATPIINKQKWSSIPVPLPPQSEQQRIVDKVDQLMTLCDQLDEQITAREEKQQTLLNAVMAQV